MIYNLKHDLQSMDGKKILECGAGGPLPPLSLFVQNGFSSTGIDISEQQLELSHKYATENNLKIDFLQGDMRSLEFADESFDYVYEHYSLCHLNPTDAQKAIDEMYRVLKKGGLCFIGVISEDTWPKLLIGEKSASGEYVTEDGFHNHCVFDDNQANKLVDKFNILDKEKVIRYIRPAAKESSLSIWKELYDSKFDYSLDEWLDLYPQREDYFKYVHLYYYLQKK